MKTYKLIQIDKKRRLGSITTCDDHTQVEIKFSFLVTTDYKTVFVKLAESIGEKNISVQSVSRGIVLNNCTEKFWMALKESLFLNLNILVSDKE